MDNWKHHNTDEKTQCRKGQRNIDQYKKAQELETMSKGTQIT